MKRTQLLTSMAALVASLTSPAWADEVANGELIEFSAGTTAVAAEVNSNFSTLQSAINGTHGQVESLQSDVSDINTELAGVQPLVSEDCPSGEAVASIGSDGTVSCVKTVPVDTRVISLPAQALTISPGREGSTYDRVYNGLRWTATFQGGAIWALRKPADYAGGDVTFTLSFSTTTAASGEASFFTRPDSVSHGDPEPAPSSIYSDDIIVSGTSDTVHEQTFTFPESRLQGDWWEIMLQRKGADASTNPETYTDDVVLRAVAIEYPVVNQ